METICRQRQFFQSWERLWKLSAWISSFTPESFFLRCFPLWKVQPKITSGGNISPECAWKWTCQHVSPSAVSWKAPHFRTRVAPVHPDAPTRHRERKFGRPRRSGDGSSDSVWRFTKSFPGFISSPANASAHVRSRWSDAGERASCEKLAGFFYAIRR